MKSVPPIVRPARQNRFKLMEVRTFRLAGVVACLALPLPGALGLHGCTGQTRPLLVDYDAPAQWLSPVSSEDGWTDERERLALQQWWSQLQDEALASLIAQALEESLDLQTAQARIREARTRRTIANADRLPSLSGSASAGRTDTTRSAAASPSTHFNAGFDAAWEIDIFGEIRNRAQAADSDIAAAVADLRNAQVTLVAEIARNYVEVRRHQQRLLVLTESLRALESLQQLAQWRAAAGMTSDLAAQQAETTLSQNEAQLPVIRVALANALFQLDILIGRAPGQAATELENAAPLPTMPIAMVMRIPADVLSQRPDVQAAALRAAAESSRTAAAQAAMYPSFRLTGSFGLDAIAQANPGLDTALVSSLLAGITAPIFQGGRLRAQRDAQGAVYDRAVLAWEQRIITALGEVETALVSLAQQQQRTSLLDIAVGHATDAAWLAQQQFQAGLTDFQPVLDTERTRLTLVDNQVNSRADALLAFVQLYKALGGGWAAEETVENADQEVP